MTLRIITDSSGGIPARVVEKLGITVIPALVCFGSEAYRDGIDITTEQFYKRLVSSKALPTTSVPTPPTFAQAYDKVAEETDEILVITISSKLSAIHEVALQSVNLMKKKCRIEVIDSNWALMAQGLIVITAAKAAKAGASLDEVVTLVRNNIPRVDIRIAFDTLEYLQRGGRIGRAQAFLGSMLKINPILCIKGGETYPVAREHSRSKVIEHLYNFAMDYSRIEEMAIEDATTPDEADKLAKRITPKFPKERIYRSKVTPAVGVHVGPHVLAVSILGDRG
jgi:DegV family protein with EDD domain